MSVYWKGLLTGGNTKTHRLFYNCSPLHYDNIVCPNDEFGEVYGANRNVLVHYWKGYHQDTYIL